MKTDQKLTALVPEKPRRLTINWIQDGWILYKGDRPHLRVEGIYDDPARAPSDQRAGLVARYARITVELIDED